MAKRKPKQTVKKTAVKIVTVLAVSVPILNYNEKRTAIILFPAFNAYFVSASGIPAATSAGWFVNVASSPVVLTLEECGDIIQREWLAISNVSSTIMVAEVLTD